MTQVKKISMPKDYRKVFTLCDIDACKRIDKSMRDGMDDGKLDISSEISSMIWLGGSMLPCDIIDVKAEFARNASIQYDRYCDGSGMMDIWIETMCFNIIDGLYIISGYLSDMWELSVENRNQIKSRLYIRHFVETETR